jgi:hypothetical protein
VGSHDEFLVIQSTSGVIQQIGVITKKLGVTLAN